MNEQEAKVFLQEFLKDAKNNCRVELATNLGDLLCELSFYQNGEYTDDYEDTVEFLENHILEHLDLSDIEEEYYLLEGEGEIILDQDRQIVLIYYAEVRKDILEKEEHEALVKDIPLPTTQVCDWGDPFHLKDVFSRIDINLYLAIDDIYSPYTIINFEVIHGDEIAPKAEVEKFYEQKMHAICLEFDQLIFQYNRKSTRGKIVELEVVGKLQANADVHLNLRPALHKILAQYNKEVLVLFP